MMATIEVNGLFMFEIIELWSNKTHFERRILKVFYVLNSISSTAGTASFRNNVLYLRIFRRDTVIGGFNGMSVFTMKLTFYPIEFIDR